MSFSKIISSWWVFALFAAAYIGSAFYGTPVQEQATRSLMLESDVRQLVDMHNMTSLLHPDLKVAVFGTGDAYGGHLKDRFKQAYPYILSAHVDNYAHFNNDNVNFFSTCFDTAVDPAKVYHVIIVDYWLCYYKGLDPLVGKLRLRFPNAMIIMLKTWCPSMFKRKESEDSEHSIDFGVWKTSVGLDAFSGVHEVNAALRNDTGHWFFPPRKLATDALEAAAEAVGADMFSFPFEDSPKQTMIDYMGYYDPSSHQRLSEIGQREIAGDIFRIINATYPDPQMLINKSDVGPMPKADDCNVFYTTGAPNLFYSMSSFGMVKLTEPNKPARHGMEIHNNGWINITNPFLDDRTLYISFLMTQNEGVYPMAMIESSPSDTSANISAIMDPLSSDRHAARHKTKTIPVGKLGPGDHKLLLKEVPSTETAYSKKFTMVGVSITDDAAVPMLYGFADTFEIEEDLLAEDDEEQQ